MTPIQIVLILVVLVIAFLYFNRLRTRLWDRAIFFTLALVGVIMVARPDWANDLARFFGVGRGADLVVYLGFSGLIFLWLGMYSRQREMDVRLTELTRQLAILRVEKPTKRKAKRKKKAAS
jgi:hypothetical protein